MDEFLLRIGIPAAVVAALHLDTLGRLVLACVLGGVVGVEREASGKPAGLRTNILICVGAALITEISVVIPLLAEEGQKGDPGRLAAQIVSGIGFIGAGTILQSRGRIIGLTSAATLWIVAAVGIAVGAHQYTVSIGATVLIILALFALRRVETLLARRRVDRRYNVGLVPDHDALTALQEMLERLGLRVRMDAIDKDADLFHLVIRATGPLDGHDRAVRMMTADPRVRSVGRG
ncbi:MAG: MgtC/SapB family protein [Gemmatimonadetes bacterium]|nr:MgtC/SapB family protein [Gemmatimonadota bacterium]